MMNSDTFIESVSKAYKLAQDSGGKHEEEMIQIIKSRIIDKYLSKVFINDIHADPSGPEALLERIVIKLEFEVDPDFFDYILDKLLFYIIFKIVEPNIEKYANADNDSFRMMYFLGLKYKNPLKKQVKIEYIDELKSRIENRQSLEVLMEYLRILQRGGNI